MIYTLSPKAIYNLADEIKSDLSNTYERMEDPAISPSDLKYWEKRRYELLGQYESARVLAHQLKELNRLHGERDNHRTFVEFAREAAE